MFEITQVKGQSVQSILDEAANRLENAESNFCYKNNFGISIFQLIPINNSFDLGISREASQLGPVGGYDTILITFMTGKSEIDRRIQTEGVNTDGSRVETNKLVREHTFWYSHLCRQIKRLLEGEEGAVNAIAHPFAKYTLKDSGYKPCSTYVQYQLRRATNSLSVVVNYRAQHLYMLAMNIQKAAFQLMQLCYKFNLKLGHVVLNCTNHHIWTTEDPNAVCGKPIPWVVCPDETSKMVANVSEYFKNF
jgi:hypothetical protein